MTSIKFRTELVASKSDVTITHCSRLLLVGSCFSDEIGARLADSGFDVIVNPTGTLYNPLSIADALGRFMLPDAAPQPELVHHEGLWHSMDHHTRFSSSSLEELHQNMAQAQTLGEEALLTASHIFVTFGSAYVFVMKSTGRIVANCHKLNPSTFIRRKLPVAEIVDCWKKTLGGLHMINPGARVIFTVSPIRHLADGLHGNQLSKSTLLLAVDELCALYPDYVSYFPAYEALIDDLRDYRFYADDMVHPSGVAVSYVYSLLADNCFSNDTRAKCLLYQKEARRARHRCIKNI